jgi:AcrR family transcriptional regulator
MSLTTKRAISNSFSELLSKTTFDKITVRDIVENCGLNRQTFYYHFHDIYDLAEWTFDDHAQIFLEKHPFDGNWDNYIILILGQLKDKKHMILNAVDSMNRRWVENYLRTILNPVITEVVRDMATGSTINEDNINFIIDLYDFMLSSLILEWVENGMSDYYTQRIDKYMIIARVSIADAIKSLEQEQNNKV